MKKGQTIEPISFGTGYSLFNTIIKDYAKAHDITEKEAYEQLFIGTWTGELTNTSSIRYPNQSLGRALRRSKNVKTCEIIEFEKIGDDKIIKCIGQYE